MAQVHKQRNEAYVGDIYFSLLGSISERGFEDWLFLEFVSLEDEFAGDSFESLPSEKIPGF